jgi:hypothetical protein
LIFTITINGPQRVKPATPTQEKKTYVPCFNKYNRKNTQPPKNNKTTSPVASHHQRKKEKSKETQIETAAAAAATLGPKTTTKPQQPAPTFSPTDCAAPIHQPTCQLPPVSHPLGL